MSDRKEPLTDAESREAADVQLMHSLLKQVSGDFAETRERRIRRVMAAVDAVQPAPSRSALIARWGVAASILIGLGLALLLSGGEQEPTALPPATLELPIMKNSAETPERVEIRVAEESMDATYDVEIRAREGSSDRTMLAELFVRKGAQYVIKRKGPRGPRMTSGYNGEETWMVPGSGAVIVDPSGRGSMMLKREKELFAFLNMREGIEALAADFEIEKLTPESLPDRLSGIGEILCEHLKGRRKKDTGPGPREIELWYDPETQLVRRMRVKNHQPGKGGRRGGRRRPGSRPDPGEMRAMVLTYELRSLDALPEDWFDHAAHHEADREIQRGGSRREK